MSYRSKGGETGLKKKNIRMIVDVAMTVLLLMLMAYSLIGEKFHEIAGTAMFVLFIGHHVLNRGWYKALFKGKYSARRIFQTVLNVLLLVFMILQPISGILMSKHLFTFIDVPGMSATAREVHLFLAYWGFVLLSIHAGTHLMALPGKLNRSRHKIWAVVIRLSGTVSIYGAYAFVKRQFADYMFMKSAFLFLDYSEPRVYFFLDYIAIMFLFAFAGYLITAGLTVLQKRGREKQNIR